MQKSTVSYGTTSCLFNVYFGVLLALFPTVTTHSNLLCFTIGVCRVYCVLARFVTVTVVSPWPHIGQTPRTPLALAHSMARMVSVQHPRLRRSRRCRRPPSWSAVLRRRRRDSPRARLTDSARRRTRPLLRSRHRVDAARTGMHPGTARRHAYGTRARTHPTGRTRRRPRNRPGRKRRRPAALSTTRLFKPR